MKKLYMLLFSIILVLALAACGASDETNSDNAEETNGYNLVSEGEFTFATSGEFAPFSVTDASGNMTGFDVDVANAVAKELGLDPAQKKFKFASIVEGVKSGRFDAAVASHTITPERQEQVSFSTPYYYSGAQVFVRPDSDIETLEDLEGLEIGLSKGSTYTTYAEQVTDDIQVYDSDVVALQALSKGHHDAVITDFLTGKEAIGNGVDIVGKELIERSEQAIAVAKDNTELLEAVNEALQTLRDNGTLAEISEEYFGNDITSKPE